MLSVLILLSLLLPAQKLLSQESVVIEDLGSEKKPISEKRLLLSLIPARVPPRREGIMVEDFEPAQTPGAPKKWEIRRENPLSFCEGTIVSTIKNYKLSKVMKLSYDLTEDKASSAALFIRTESVSPKRVKHLNISVMGDKSGAFPESFIIELKGRRFTARKTIKGLGPNWQDLNIPMEDFKVSDDGGGEIENVRIILEKTGLSTAKGTMFIDDISFSDTEEFRPAPEYYINTGNEYARASEYEKARKAYEKALLIDPENLFARINLGVSCTKERKFVAAAEHFKKAIAVNPKCAAAHLNLAVIYDECLYKKEKAREHYAKFLEYDTSLDFKKRRKVRLWLEEASR